MELVNDVRLLFSISFVNRKKERTPRLPQQAYQFEVGTGKSGTAIHDHHDGRRFIERNPSLPKDLRRNEIFFFGKNAAGVDDADAAAAPLGVTIKAVARDAGLIADDGAPRSGQMIEQCRFADVRASNDRDEWSWFFFAQGLLDKSRG